MKTLLEYTAEQELLNEKQIQFQKGAKYGQVVFLAGGAASGKGVALNNFMQPERFKVRDVDEWKKLLIKLDGIAADVDKEYAQKGIDTQKKFGARASKLNLKNPEDVFRLHDMVSQLGWKAKTLDLLLAGATNKDRLPNIMFDITLKNLNQLKVIDKLIDLGYDPKNIHLVWILSDFTVAMKRNKTRSRVVPEFKVIETHKGAATTMLDIVKGNVPKGLNGRITVVLNNDKETIWYKDKNGKDLKLVKSFTTLDMKREGKGLVRNSVVDAQLFSWIKQNAPKEVSKDLKL